jgi:hypothetical protein
VEGRKRRRQSRWKKTEEDRRKGWISTLEEEDGKGHTDIFRLPTRKQFQVTADISLTGLFNSMRLSEKLSS